MLFPCVSSKVVKHEHTSFRVSSHFLLVQTYERQYGRTRFRRTERLHFLICSVRLKLRYGSEMQNVFGRPLLNNLAHGPMRIPIS